MDDFDEPPPRDKTSYPTPVSKMSKVPSWVSLGFVLGAVFVLAWPKPAPRPPEVKIVKVVPPTPTETKLTTVEAIFAQWGHLAVWSEDVTEIALWNPGTQEFTEFYEVRRVGGALYFRSIGELTRRVIRHGKPLPPECPLDFTETEEQYQEWLEHGRKERRSNEKRLSLDGKRIEYTTDEWGVVDSVPNQNQIHPPPPSAGAPPLQKLGKEITKARVEVPSVEVSRVK